MRSSRLWRHLRRNPSTRSQEVQTPSELGPRFEGDELTDSDIAALLYLAIQTQLGLAGDENAAQVAAFTAAGWTDRLTRIVDHAYATGSIKHHSSTVPMIREGLHQLEAVAARDGFSELVLLALGGHSQLAKRAAGFASDGHSPSVDAGQTALNRVRTVQPVNAPRTLPTPNSGLTAAWQTVP